MFYNQDVLENVVVNRGGGGQGGLLMLHLIPLHIIPFLF